MELMSREKDKLLIFTAALLAEGQKAHGLKLNCARPLEAVKNTRKLKKKDMVHNDWQPKTEVDSETYEVRADGELLECEPALNLRARLFISATATRRYNWETVSCAL
jgi:urease alpha subunit